MTALLWKAGNPISPAVDETNRPEFTARVALQRADGKLMTQTLHLHLEGCVGGAVWFPLSTITPMVFRAGELKHEFTLQTVTLLCWRLVAKPAPKHDLELIEQWPSGRPRRRRGRQMTTHTVKVDPEYAAHLQQQTNERLVDELIAATQEMERWYTRNAEWPDSRKAAMRDAAKRVTVLRAKVLEAMKGTAP